MRWLLQGCLLQQQEGLHAPAAVVEATDQYKKEMDTVKQFIDECVVKDAAAEIQALTAFECYEKWCENNGERTVTNTMFGRRMTEYGFTKEKKGGRFIYQGFTICAEALKELALYDLLMSHRN